MCLSFESTINKTKISKARDLYGINKANSIPGFSWEKLPPQRVMRGHQENCVRTNDFNKIEICLLVNFFLNFAPKGRNITCAKRTHHFCEAKTSRFSAGETHHSTYAVETENSIK